MSQLSTHYKLKQLLKVLQRVKRKGSGFNLNQLIGLTVTKLQCPTTTKELHQCGAVACVAGHWALSPEGQSLGLMPTPNGLIKYKGHLFGGAGVEDLMSMSIGITTREAYHLCFAFDNNIYYGNKLFKDVTVDDSIDAVKTLIKEYKDA